MQEFSVQRALGAKMCTCKGKLGCVHTAELQEVTGNSLEESEVTQVHISSDLGAPLLQVDSLWFEN